MARSETIDVCFVADELAPHSPGGIGQFLRQALKTLSGAGFRCAALLDVDRRVFHRALRDAEQSLPGVRLFSVEQLRRGGIPPESFRHWQYGRSYQVWRALTRLSKRTRLRVVEFPDFGALGFVSLSAKRVGLCPELMETRLAVRIHGSDSMRAETERIPRWSPDTAILHAIEGWSVRDADTLIAPWQAVVDEYRDCCDELPSQISTAPLPYERIGERGSHLPPTGIARVLFVGRLQHVKGPDLLVRAAVDTLRACGPGSIEIELIGADTESAADGSYGRWLNQMIPEELQSSFHFRGAVSKHEIVEASRRCHAAVFPSRSETYCLAAHELAWLGVPLLLRDLPAFLAAFPDSPMFRCRLELTELLTALAEDPGRFASQPPAVTQPEQAFVNQYRELVGEEPVRKRVTLASVEPMVSVVVPYFDMEDYIDATIGSVLASDDPRWELILVDDESSASGKAKLVELEGRFRQDARVRFLWLEHGGLGRARNKGIEAARGRYILPLDADDLIGESYIRKAVSALERNPGLQFVSCFASRFRRHPNPRADRDLIVPYGLDPVLICWENGAGTASTVFRRSLFQQFRYNESMAAYEDWDLFCALAAAGIRGAVLPEVLFFYRQRRSGIARVHGHAKHHALVQEMIDRHGLLGEQRAAFEAYLYSEGGHLYPIVRSVYLRWLKGPMEKHLGPTKTRRLAAIGRKLIRVFRGSSAA